LSDEKEDSEEQGEDDEQGEEEEAKPINKRTTSKVLKSKGESVKKTQPRKSKGKKGTRPQK
jgi:hypothetical protein